jgi:transposase-like protein
MSTKRYSAAEWRVLVEEWLSSGKSKAEFARSRGVSAATLSWWRWKLGAKATAVPPTFLEVVVEDPPSAPDLVVEVGELRVRVPFGFDAGEVRRLVGALC